MNIASDPMLHVLQWRLCVAVGSDFVPRSAGLSSEATFNGGPRSLRDADAAGAVTMDVDVHVNVHASEDGLQLQRLARCCHDAVILSFSA
eukprot:11222059-Lingulodinium_polyedra.AAC.1